MCCTRGLTSRRLSPQPSRVPGAGSCPIATASTEGARTTSPIHSTRFQSVCFSRILIESLNCRLALSCSIFIKSSGRASNLHAARLQGSEEGVHFLLSRTCLAGGSRGLGRSRLGGTTLCRVHASTRILSRGRLTLIKTVGSVHSTLFTMRLIYVLLSNLGEKMGQPERRGTATQCERGDPACSWVFLSL